jgi:hypothetical protein
VRLSAELGNGQAPAICSGYAVCGGYQKVPHFPGMARPFSAMLCVFLARFTKQNTSPLLDRWTVR